MHEKKTEIELDFRTNFEHKYITNRTIFVGILGAGMSSFEK